MISNSGIDSIETQGHCIAIFLDPDEIALVNAFARERGGASRVAFFFRGQLLELLRWAALLCSDHPNDGTTFDSRDTRRAFVRAALMASDVWGRRIYRDRLDGDYSAAQLRQNVLPSIRRMRLENAPCPSPFLHLARGASLFADRMRFHAPDMEEAFQRATGLNVDDYFSILTQVAADSLGKTPEGLHDPQKSGLFSTKGYEGAHAPVGMIAKTFFALEAQTADELRLAFWGNRTDADESDAQEFELKTLRERPIFRATDGRAIVLDPVFFVERGSVGPLFHLVGEHRDPRIVGEGRGTGRGGSPFTAKIWAEARWAV